MFKNIGLLVVMVLIPTAAFLGSHLQEPKLTQAESDARWVSDVVNPTVDLWRNQTRRCEFNWQMDNLPRDVTGVVQLPKVPSNIHATCFQIAVDMNPVPTRK